MFLPQLLHRVALRPTASHFHRESFWFAVIRDCWQEVRVTDRANQRLRQALVEGAAMAGEMQARPRATILQIARTWVGAMSPRARQRATNGLQRLAVELLRVEAHW